MTLRTRIALALYRLIDRIDPEAWKSVPIERQRPVTDSIANVEIVRDLGAGTFDVKRTPRECRKYRGFYPAGPCPATECEYPNCISDGFVSRYAVKPRTPLQRRRAAKPQPPVPKPGKGG